MRQGGRNAEAARGVFAVGDGQVDVFGNNDFGQVASNNGTARRGENVAYKQEVGQERNFFLRSANHQRRHNPRHLTPKSKGGTLRAP